MIHRDITVERPRNTKIQKKDGHRYVYFVTSSEYKPDRGYNTDKRVCVGRMVEDDKESRNEHMYPNDAFREFFPNEEGMEVEFPDFSRTLKVGGSLMIRKIMMENQMYELIRSVYEEEADTILNLIVYMILFETSVFQYYPEMMRNHPVYGGKIHGDGYLSEFLRKEEQEERVRLFMLGWNQIRRDKEAIYISYDSTNINTSAENMDMAEFGHAKDDPDLPQVNISYAVDQKDGTPLFYELYAGSVIDNQQCDRMVEKAADYGYHQVGFILDRGYYSGRNIRYMDNKGYEFVIMMKDCYRSVKEIIQPAMIQLRQFKAKYYIAEHDVCGMTVEGSLYGKKRYMHVYFNNSRAAAEENRIMEGVAEKERQLIALAEKKTVQKEKIEKNYKEFKLKADMNGYLLSYKQNDKYIQKMMENTGYFVIVTSEKMSAERALDIYRDRDISESMFMMMKSELEYSKFRVHGDQAMKAKTQIVFLASIVRNAIHQKLKPVIKQTKDRKNYTVPAALHALENIEVTKNNHDKYMREYALTKRQKKILAAADLSVKDVDLMAQNLPDVF